MANQSDVPPIAPTIIGGSSVRQSRRNFGPTPREIKDASGLPSLIEAMSKAGFDQTDLRKFAFDNWLRVFGLTWKGS
ncbi:membrane dipeptidase [Rhizobium sp. 11_C7_N12_5]|uniref:membrane dipeptidase n=1 Tax=Rhizobium sp. 11_C7_N12_5 TaxID=3240770 RepID=UPI003F2919FE